MDHREILGQQIIADDAGDAGIVLSSQLAGGILQLGRTEVARGCVDQIAAEPHRFDDGERAGVIGLAAHPELGDLLRAGRPRLVAPIAVGTEPPGDGGEHGIGHVLGQMVEPRR